MRNDLLALTADGLAALANRGLLKRATKELDAGAVPDIDTAADGTVRAVFADGTEAVLPVDGGLAAATCTCSAAAGCRHRVGAVLAYQRRHAASDDVADAPATVATPAAITDDELREAFGRHALTAAEKSRRAGYTARLTWPGPDRPAVAELPTCTVSFLVPGRLGYVHTDATGPARDTGIVLAVWAFRQAAGEGDQSVDIGGTGADTGLGAATDLAAQVLHGGVESVDGVLTAALDREAAALTRRRLHWPAGAVRDLVEQVGHYHRRSAAYDPQRFAELLAELPARAAAAGAGGGADGGTPAARVLGSDEAERTPLTLVRLTALGCRVGTDGERRTVAIYLAHPETGMVLTVRRDWELPDGGRLTGGELSDRRLVGCRIGQIASGTVVSEAASRTAARALRLGTGRLAKTQVLPLGRSWDDLPASLRITDLDAAAVHLAALPPALIRPRVAAERVRVVAVDGVEPLGYDPAAQTFDAFVTAPGGGRARLRAVHSAAAPGALEAIATALREGVTAVAGTVTRHRGETVIAPTALLTADGPVVPDLAAGDDGAELDAGAATVADPLAAAIETAWSALADAAHTGLRHSRAPTRRLLDDAAAALGRVGLRAAARETHALVTALGGDDEAARAAAWTRAAIRLQVTAELH